MGKKPENSAFRACMTILLRETEILGKIPPLQTLLRDAVINREWADYEIFLETIGRLSAEFKILEAERSRFFLNLTDDAGVETAGDGQSRFYIMAARLPETERNELTAMYRRLKMESLRIKLANDTLMNFIQETRAAINGVLEKAYPDRKGKIYSSSGAEREADMRSVILNQSL